MKSQVQLELWKDISLSPSPRTVGVKAAPTVPTVPIRVVGYSSWGDLDVVFEGERICRYRGVSPYLYRRVCVLLGHRNYRKVSEILRRL